jgi:hypothetical protein
MSTEPTGLDELFRFDIEGVHWTEPGPHPIVKGVVYGSDLTPEQQARFRVMLKGVALRIYGDVTNFLQQSPTDALKAYIEMYGPLHDEDCPADDTCACSLKWINDGLNQLVRELEGTGA